MQSICSVTSDRGASQTLKKIARSSRESLGVEKDGENDVRLGGKRAVAVVEECASISTSLDVAC
jgi:hypothetical protein